MRKDDGEQKEHDEQARLAVQLATADKREEEAWKIKSDTAAFGRKRIVVPDTPY